MKRHRPIFIFILSIMAIHCIIIFTSGCNESDDVKKKSDQVPNAHFSFEETALTVKFYDKSVDDGKIISREWDFGDRSPVIKSELTELSHTYGEFATYEVKLTVIDDKGQIDIFTQDIELIKPIGIISVQHKNVIFGEVMYGDELTKKLFVRNTGNDAINELFIHSYPDNNDFSFSLAESKNLTPNRYTEFNITFIPKSLGEKDVNVVIGADNLEIEPSIINISGTCIAKDLVVDIKVVNINTAVFRRFPKILPIEIKQGNEPYECTINWGDTQFNTDIIESNSLITYSHTYNENGDYEIEINVTDCLYQTFYDKHFISVSDQELYTNSIGMTFVRIPAGVFMMGSPPDELGRVYNESLHEVTLTKDFYLQSTEITNRQWKAVMENGASGYKDNYPVNSISWDDTQEFIDKLNQIEDVKRYRLPTEAEWEYAARAGAATAIANGEVSVTDCEFDPNMDAIAWYCGNSDTDSILKWGGSPVAQKLPNAWGLYDMHGNVWEWCNDWAIEWDLFSDFDYDLDPVTDPSGPISGTVHVYRGGSWFYGASQSRSAQRILILDMHLMDLGARLAFDANIE